MKGKVFIVWLAICLFFSATSVWAWGNSGEKTYKLRFGHVLSPEDEFNSGMERWAEAVKEKTNGRLDIEIYPSSQLGLEEDVLEQLKQGTSVGWQTDPARLGSYVKEWSIFYAPFFLSNLDEVKKLIDSKVVHSWVDKLEKEHNIKVISYAWVQGYRNVFANKPAHSPKEMDGLLIRTASAPMWVATVNSLGCKAVALPYGDIYNGIQTKLVDGCELPYAAAKASKIDEVTKYIIETRHIFQANAMVVSSEWYNSLPEDLQKILVDECNKAGLASSQKLISKSDSVKQEMISQGITVIPHEELDMAAFTESGMKVYGEMGLGEVRDAIFKEMGKN